MEKVKHTQMFQTQEYGDFVCYGFICNSTKHYLSSMKTTETLHKGNFPLTIIKTFGEYPRIKVAPAYKDWEAFLSIQSNLFDELMLGYNIGDFTAITNFSIQHKDLGFALPLLLKNYELIRSGKKNVFAIKIKDRYCFKIDKELFEVLAKELGE